MANPLQKLGDLNQLRSQAMQMQRQLAAEELEITRGDIRVVITGDQKIKIFSVQGITSQPAIDALNEAVKKSQETAAKKLQSMSGGLGGLLSGKMGDMNQLRQQAMQMQQQLAQEEIEVNKDDIRVVITGDQKIKIFSVQGITSQPAIDALNEAIKKSQELAARKLQEMSGGLGGLLGGK
ncbi:hypothetical protein C5B42_01685 [Candidatus Cerribacteria bacterium 'Amazon FNV 2010 28 9']|uniref:Nucleoid-associated protein, YbaB/EbfC family n=1 Tax=Candidatus Cerribacteria bacterium 'Amazon FNV 2010 28 9' TaxID=2081795 RepID=A0A317JPR8_9BACT|nr:MAG: hypothetical protein C5B42_01685 [Candidatus Cerribacteria bacterium 'Amazon FNV 2010 28 9']